MILLLLLLPLFATAGPLQPELRCGRYKLIGMWQNLPGARSRIVLNFGKKSAQPIEVLAAPLSMRSILADKNVEIIARVLSEKDPREPVAIYEKHVRLVAGIEAVPQPRAQLVASLACTPQ